MAPLGADGAAHSLGSMETRLSFFILVLILLFSPFSAVSGDPVRSPIIYSRDQLLALIGAATRVA